MHSILISVHRKRSQDFVAVSDPNARDQPHTSIHIYIRRVHAEKPYKKSQERGVTIANKREKR